MGIINLVKKGLIEIWDDVFEARLDDKAAPDLGDIVRGEEEPIYSDPEEFFKRTYLTKSMEELLEETAEIMKNGKGGAIFLLTALFGGGKTHTLISLYHAYTSPEKLKAINEKLSAKIAEIGKPLIVVMDGSRAGLVPHPDEPYEAEGFTIKTIWGMLAYRLGAYAKIKHLDSEEKPVPDVDLLKTILSETKEPKLILMDEIVHYVYNMHKSKKLKDYGDNVLLFLDYLARAIEDTPKTVLVISVQAEYRMDEGRKSLVEQDVFKGYASKVLQPLHRESTRIIVPVSPDDVVKVLQKRIFRKISENEALRARDELHDAYRAYPELFGVEADWQYSSGEAGRVATAKDTYPFHPKYVEVLQEFVTRNRDLQKTRDAVRITRKVVRRLLKGKEDASFIMPWHIDLRDSDIRSSVLTESRKEFRDVTNRDIATEEGRLGSVRECTKPLLALRIATAVLLKTYTYESFKEPLKVFPDQRAIALMVYEPETFKNEKLQPADIQTTLEEMHGRLPHFTSESQRYWFTPLPSVIEYVEKKAEELRRGPTSRLYARLRARAIDLLVEKRRGGTVERGEIFDEQNCIVMVYGDEVPEAAIPDSPSMKLVVMVKPEVSEEEVRRIILMRGDSGKRTYKNTVAVVCPSKESNFEDLLKYAAKIEAAEEVRNALAEYYPDEDIRKLQQGKLKRYIQENEQMLDQQLLATLTRIAYPAKGKNNDEIRWVDTTATSSIISQVETGLKDPSTGPKLRTDFSFKDLADFLKDDFKWDLIEGKEPRELREIVGVFYNVTSAPFTTRTAIEDAVIKGLETLDIGVKVDGRLYWKRIGPKNGAEYPPRPLKDTAEILPYSLAAESLKDQLERESGVKRVGKETHVIEYEVEFANKRIKLADLINRENWQKILKEAVILEKKQIIERGFILKASPPAVTVRPGEEIKITVKVEPVEEYPFQVELTAGHGKISSPRGKPPFETSWSIGQLEPGYHNFTLTAKGEDEFTSSLTVTVTVESPEEEVEVNKLDLAHEGAKLLSINLIDMTSLKLALSLASKLNLKAEADIRLEIDESIKFSGENMDLKLASIFVEKFIDVLRLLPSLEEKVRLGSSIRLKEPVTLDDVKIRNLAQLDEKNTSFRLRVGKRD